MQQYLEESLMVKSHFNHIQKRHFEHLSLDTSAIGILKRNHCLIKPVSRVDKFLSSSFEREYSSSYFSSL